MTTTSLPAGSSPVFVDTTESATVYTANFGTGHGCGDLRQQQRRHQLIRVDPSQNPLVPDQTSKPVALAETPDGKKLYVVNQGTGSVTSINTLDGSINGNSVIPTGALSGLGGSALRQCEDLCVEQRKWHSVHDRHRRPTR